MQNSVSHLPVATSTPSIYSYHERHQEVGAPASAARMYSRSIKESVKKMPLYTASANLIHFITTGSDSKFPIHINNLVNADALSKKKRKWGMSSRSPRITSEGKILISHLRNGS